MTANVHSFDRHLVIALLLVVGFVQTTSGQQQSVNDYPRAPMRVSRAPITRQPLRVAQFEPGYAPNTTPPRYIPRTTPPDLQQSAPLASDSYNLTPMPNNSFGQPWSDQVPAPPSVGVDPNFAGDYSAPNFAAPTYTAPSYVPPGAPAPGYAPPNAFNPNLGNQGFGNQGVGNQGFGNLAPGSPYGLPSAQPTFGAPIAPASGFNNENVFGNADVFRTPYDEVSPFGRQPLSPYAQTDFNDEVVDADLVVGLTPSRRTLNYGAGVGFNSDLGLFGQFIYDDRDFDWRAAPWLNPPTSFRGGGQRLRIEAMPGADAQRYLVSFTEPYFTLFGGQPVALNLSGFYFDREYFDWDERRSGGRVGFSYYLSRELLLSTKFRIENVDLSNPRILVPELQRSLGDSDLYGASVSLAYDTRDNTYAPTSGGYLSASFEQVFGTFDYPRGTVNYKNYTTFLQRPDYSGRHVLGLHFDGGITGSQTPIFENFFAGGISTMRGFRFRHASPKDQGVIVGGELSLLGSAEYFFPVTADDMVRGVFFTDFGSISETTTIDSDDFRLSVGGGMRLIVPALGPAPLAIDVAVPLIRDDDDRVQNVQFWISVGR